MGKGMVEYSLSMGKGEKLVGQHSERMSEEWMRDSPWMVKEEKTFVSRKVGVIAINMYKLDS